MGEPEDPRLEKIRGLIDAFNREDWEEIRQGAHPDVEIQRPGGLGVTVGADDAVGNMAPEVMESQRLELHELEIRGHVALARFTLRARGTGSGIEVEQRMWTVYRFEGDLVRRLEHYLDQDEAVAAAWG